MSPETVLALILVLALLLLAPRLAGRLLLLLLKSGAAWLALSLAAPLLASFGLSLGANPLNSLTLGALGLPGLGLLLALHRLAG